MTGFNIFVLVLINRFLMAYYNGKEAPEAVQPALSSTLFPCPVSDSVEYPRSCMFNGVCGVGIPYTVDVELEPGVGAGLDTLRSHSESRVFLMFELWKLDSRDFRDSLSSAKVPGKAKLVSSSSTSARAHFLACLRKS